MRILLWNTSTTTSTTLIPLLLSILAFPSVLAQSNTFVPAASTFYLEKAETQFSVNIANDSSDVYFHFASPAYSWVGVGFGAKMEDSLMLIMYPDANGDNVTISPRIGRSGGEPVLTTTVEIEVLDGTGVQDGMMVLNARCKDCRVWPHGFLDATSPEQDMIYAFGSHAVYSSSPSADLKRHVRYGQFTMDMTAATGMGGVPRASSASSGVQMQGDMTRDSDRKSLAHALLGCLVLFVVWPLNVLIAGFIRNIRFHIGFSVVTVICLGVVYGLGISTSTQYNRSKPFTDPHQILAFIALAPLLLLCLLPLPHPSILHPSIPRAHGPLSALTLTLLLISGGLGLHLAQQIRPLVLLYTALSLLLIIFLSIIHAIVRRRGSAHTRATSRFPLSSASSSELGLLRKESGVGSGSEAGGSVASLKGFLDESRRDAGAGAEEDEQKRQRGKLFGGGTMPGPQYLLNMHPGVPVHIGSGRRI